MPACAIVGDCLATHDGLGKRFPACAVHAKVGLASARIVPLVPTQPVAYLVISAGSNDPLNPHLADNLRAMRARASAGLIVWIAPARPAAAAVVRQVASAHGDAVVAFVPGRDHVHPKSYGRLAASVRAVLAR